MKKILIISILFILINSVGYSQYFQGGFQLGSDDTLIFKMKPVGGDITTQISYIETAFRFLTAQAPSLTTSAPISNTAFFGSGLLIQSLPPNYVEGDYTYIKFVHNTGVLASKTYTSGTEYEIFRVKLSQTPTVALGIEMASNLTTESYVFGIVDGTGVLIDPGANDQLYGTGFYKSGDGQYVPLDLNPSPVKFLGFSATKKDQSALLNWQIENEDANTASYVIERSLNGVDFTTLATIPAKNNGISFNNYTYTDNNLSTVFNGVVYYRVKQLDKDGKFIYTSIQSVRFSGKGTIVNIYPNPVKNIANLTIDVTEDTKLSITLTDASGKEINKLQIPVTTGLNTHKIDMSKLSAGTYNLQVQSGSEIKTISVVKTN